VSVSDVTARIGQIQAQLALLQPTSSSTATAFSASLNAASSTTGTSTTYTPTGGVTGADVVATARKYLGVPYVWGGTDPDKGLDCSGLTQLVYKQLGVDLPRVSRDQATQGRAVSSLKEAQPGDLLFFGSPVHHVAIYVGDGKMIEAPRPGLSVRISEVYETPSAIRRVLPETSTTTLTGRTGVDASVPFSSLFNTAGAKYGVSPALLSAVAKQESGYDPTAVSSAGAQGLMQLMPATARGLGVTDSFDPAQAIDGAAHLLHDLLDQFGRTDLALAAYNAGPGAVLRYNGIPPYAETQNYVRSVMAMIGGTA
jgi:cell wall-associated NlpC family hydrolase